MSTIQILPEYKKDFSNNVLIHVSKELHVNLFSIIYLSSHINLDIIKNDVKSIISAYLRKSGNFHLLKKKSGYKSDELNVFHLLHNKHLRWEFFTLHQISRCSNTINDENKKGMFCFKFNHAFSFLQKIFVDHSNETRKDFRQFLTDMRTELVEDEDSLENALNLTINFISKIVMMNNDSGRNAKSIVVKVKDINRILFPNSTSSFDWLRIINNFFMKKSAANLNDDIFIENSEVI